jgi:hypothetical protein
VQVEVQVRLLRCRAAVLDRRFGHQAIQLAA